MRRQVALRMKLSIVATLYRSAQHVSEFHRRAEAVARQMVGEDYEIVLVNDGSPDDSLELAVRITETDPHLVVVDLSRNFGHHKAMMTGLEYSHGELVFLIDSDLEEEPEWLSGFAALMESEEADVVYGRQQHRKGGWFERLSGDLYYSVFNWLCNIEHPRNIVTARLMTRRYVDALLRHREREIVISCLWVITGFKQCEMVVRKHMSSSTTYGLRRKLSLAINTITSFSEVPLKLIFFVGVYILGCSIAYTAYLIVRRLATAHPVDGWTSVMVSVWLLGGIMISFIGLIGMYLAKVFAETKQRPSTIIRAIYGQTESTD